MAEAKAKDSKRVSVKVRRQERNKTGPVFVSTMIRKNNKDVLEVFRFPVGRMVDLPVEAIAVLRTRKVNTNINAADVDATAEFQMLPEYHVEEV